MYNLVNETFLIVNEWISFNFIDINISAISDVTFPAGSNLWRKTKIRDCTSFHSTLILEILAYLCFVNSTNSYTREESNNKFRLSGLFQKILIVLLQCRLVRSLCVEKSANLFPFGHSHSTNRNIYFSLMSTNIQNFILNQQTHGPHRSPESPWPIYKDFPR
jgi:hypothetical protein